MTNVWIVKVLTIFPEMFPGPLKHSIIGNALDKKIWDLQIQNLRNYAKDKHRTVDDKPYGGGNGLLMNAEIVANGIEDFFLIESKNSKDKKKGIDTSGEDNIEDNGVKDIKESEENKIKKKREDEVEEDKEGLVHSALHDMGVEEYKEDKKNVAKINKGIKIHLEKTKEEINRMKGAITVLMSPRGKKLDQELVMNLIQHSSINIICGAFEGIDDRIHQEFDIMEISIGDYILPSGELAAMILVSACVRMLDSVLGSKESLHEESFSQGHEDYKYLLEYPQYTTPQNWRGHQVPEILLSGNHSKIAEWRLENAVRITKEKRLDLWKKYVREKEDKKDD